jgi:uridine kinase
LLLAPPDAVPVFDGVFLLRPQLNDAWDLRIFLQVDFQETPGCPTFDSRT